MKKQKPIDDPNAVTPEQLQTLVGMSFEGVVPQSNKEASTIIRKLKREKKNENDPNNKRQ